MKQGVLATLTKIESSSLSRLLHTHLSKYHCATISACRSYRREAYSIFRDKLNQGKKLWEIPDSDVYLVSKKENKLRNTDLGNRLHRAGNYIGITQIQGVFHEQGAKKPSLEASFIVFSDDFNNLKESILKLGTLYEQDSVCIVEKQALSGAEYKTSPKDINAYSDYPLYAPVRKFKGIEAGDSSNYYEKNEDKMEAFFSSIKGRPFRFSVIKASEFYLKGKQFLYPHIQASQYRFIKGDYLLPIDKLSTTKLQSYCKELLNSDTDSLQRRLVSKLFKDSK